jgi:tRNA pseudouridine13 synthase
VGYAGLKDTRAVTRQYLSVPRVPTERVLAIRHPHFRVLTASRHTGPLRIGHHRGNRFTIRIRGVDRDRIPAARRALEAMGRRGLPNVYGSQRFGVRQDGHLLGRSIVEEDWAGFLDRLLGDPSPLEKNPRMIAARQAYDRGDIETCLAQLPLKHRSEKKAAATLLRTGSPLQAFLALGRRPRRMWIAAWQSYLFNRVLARRIADDTFDRVLPGDVAALEVTGACFATDPDGDISDARPGGERIVPTGPVLGYDMDLARGRPGTLEREILQGPATHPESFRADHVRARGSRRPLCVPVWQAGLEDRGDGSVIVRFVLPPGAFATILLERLIGRPV